MTDMELRLRIAELVGWFSIEIRKPGIDGRLCGYMKDADGNYLFGGGCSEIPHYESDLNAMHEAENLMTEEQKYRYDTVLENRTKYHSDPPRWRWNATARQRAEAYVKVMQGDKE